VILRVSLDNERLYAGLDIVVEAGKRNLRTPPDEAIPRIVENLEAFDIDVNEVVLTGPMAIWAYLVIAHALHGRTRRLVYEDGLGQRIVVAAHG
jgi:CRISPR-associated protein (Cas_csx3)